MAKVTVKSPNPEYSGITAGIQFSNGEATFDPARQHAAARYFDRHGYTYGEPEPVEADEPAEPVAAEQQPAEPDTEAPPADGDEPDASDAATADEPAPVDDEPAKPARTSKAKTAGD